MPMKNQIKTKKENQSSICLNERKIKKSQMSIWLPILNKMKYKTKNFIYC